MDKNKCCASYLGCYVAESVLSKVFKNVEIMPNNNPGYDFRCSKDYLVDVKSSCMHVREGRSDSWSFHICKNKIADYFLCIAFDSRADLNPEYIWLIPGERINHLMNASISISAIHKWDEYKLDIDKVVDCCNSLKAQL